MEDSRTIAYLRTATITRDLEKTKADIVNLANDKGLGEVEWVEEVVSGLVPWKKRKIAQILEELQPGDRLVIRDLSRLSRSDQQCAEILSIASEKRIHIFIID